MQIKIKKNMHGPELARYQDKEKMLKKLLQSNIGKDREVEEIEHVETRVNTGGGTYRFKVDEWIDYSDEPD